MERTLAVNALAAAAQAAQQDFTWTDVAVIAICVIGGIVVLYLLLTKGG